MSSYASITAPETLTEGKRTALVQLLADDDPAIYHEIRARILACGPAAVEWLRPRGLSNDPIVRRRVREIIDHIGRQTADNEFLTFCLKQGEDLNLEQGMWLLARTRHPGINVEALQSLLDFFARDLRARIDWLGRPENILASINIYLFNELAFSGDDANYYDPENSYLNRVLDRRRGNPISLSILYMAVARRLNLPIVGIGLPGHFICRFQSNLHEELYIDVFHGGKVWSKADCIQYLRQNNFALEDDHLLPATPRRILMRVCANLHQIYQRRDCPGDATRFQRYLIALAR